MRLRAVCLALFSGSLLMSAVAPVAAEAFSPKKANVSDEVLSRLEAMERRLGEVGDLAEWVKQMQAEEEVRKAGLEQDTSAAPKASTPVEQGVEQEEQEDLEEQEEELSPEAAYVLERSLTKRFTVVGEINGRHVVRHGEELLVLDKEEFEAFVAQQNTLVTRALKQQAAANPNAFMDSSFLVLPAPSSNLSMPAGGNFAAMTPPPARAPVQAAPAAKAEDGGATSGADAPEQPDSVSKPATSAPKSASAAVAPERPAAGASAANGGDRPMTARERLEARRAQRAAKENEEFFNNTRSSDYRANAGRAPDNRHSDYRASAAR